MRRESGFLPLATGPRHAIHAAMSTAKRGQRATDRSRAQSVSTLKGYKKTRADHAREMAEDYVELIQDLMEETGEARTVDIAARLGVTHVTVANTIARLKKAGLAKSEPYRAIFLTAEGERLAEKARARHTLVLEFLMALGVPRKEAETDSEGIEHHLSPATLEAMQRFLRRLPRKTSPAR